MWPGYWSHEFVVEQPNVVWVERSNCWRQHTRSGPRPERAPTFAPFWRSCPDGVKCGVHHGLGGVMNASVHRLVPSA